MIDAGVEPMEPYASGRKPWPCRCLTCGKTVSPRLDAILAGQGGCRWCGNRVVDAEAAAVTMRESGLVTLVLYPGALVPWECECTSCGRTVSPRFADVRKGHAGCKWCSWREVGLTRRVDEASAMQVMLESRLKPVVPYSGKDVPWRSLCLNCNREVTPSYASVRDGHGCRLCAPWGFDTTQPAVVYVVTNKTLGAAKVGIGNSDADRPRRLGSRGWELVGVVRVPGEAARDIERAILDWWRNDLGLPPYLSKSDMPQNGWTETVELDEVDVPETIRRIERLATQIEQAALKP